MNMVQDQSEPELRITRVRGTLTEKGQAYQGQRQREHEKDEDQLIKKIYESYEAWKTQATDIDSIGMAKRPKQLSSSQVERREEAILRLEDLRDKTRKIYVKTRNDRAPAQQIFKGWTDATQ